MADIQRWAAVVLVGMLCACQDSTGVPPAGDDVLGVSQHAPTGDRSVSDQGLVASYDMTTLTGDGRLRDFSGNGLHGEIQNTTTVETQRGGGRRFAEATDRVALPGASAFDLDGPLSVVARFRLERTGQHQHVVACDDKWVIWLTENDEIRFANTLGDAVVSVERLSDEEWHVVVGVFRGTAGDVLDDATGEIWLDGERMEVDFLSSTGTEPVIWRESTLREAEACFIGFESHGGDPSHQNLAFYGVVDEVMVFDRALTPGEVAAVSVSP